MTEASEKMPLTLSNLLASGENGRKVIESIYVSIGVSSPIYEWLDPWHIFWNIDRYRENGYVYLMRAEGSNYFKIGKSVNPERRLKQIYPKMPFQTQIVGVRKTNHMSLREKFLHKDYESVRANGEWFNFAGLKDSDWVFRYFADQSEDQLEDLLGSLFCIDTPDSTWEWQRENFDTSPFNFYRLAQEVATLIRISGRVEPSWAEVQ